MDEIIGYKQIERIQLEREEHRKYWLYSEADLQAPASTKRGVGADGGKKLTLEEEQRFRDQAAGHIQHVVKEISRLKPYCDHVHAGTMSTAIMFFHRFYMEQSFMEVGHLPMAICCIYVAMKIDRKPKGGSNSSSKQQINTLIHQTLDFVFRMSPSAVQLSPSVTYLKKAREAKQLFDKKKVKPKGEQLRITEQSDAAVKVFRDELCYNECLLLSTLGFNTLEVRLPITYIVHYINIINIPADQRDKFIKEACRQLNSTLGATFGLLYPPEVIACCMITRAARVLDSALPKPKKEDHGKTWINAVLLSEKVPLLLHGEVEAQDPTVLVDKLNTSVDKYIVDQKRWLDASHNKGRGRAPPPPHRRVNNGSSGGGGSASSSSSPRRSRRKSSSDGDGSGSGGGAPKRARPER